MKWEQLKHNLYTSLAFLRVTSRGERQRQLNSRSRGRGRCDKCSEGWDPRWGLGTTSFGLCADPPTPQDKASQSPPAFPSPSGWAPGQVGGPASPTLLILKVFSAGARIQRWGTQFDRVIPLPTTTFAVPRSSWRPVLCFGALQE